MEVAFDMRQVPVLQRQALSRHVHFSLKLLPIRVDPMIKLVELGWKLKNSSSNLARISKYLLALSSDKYDKTS